MIGIGVLAQVATAVTVVVALVFGILQVRHLRKTRAIFSSAELVHAMQTQEFTRAIDVVSRLPDGAPPDMIESDPAALAASQLLGHIYESFGVMVYRRIVPLHLVDDLLGGYIRMSWRKLAPFIESRRKGMGVYYGEWMQWLAERLAEHPSPGKNIGAHIAHRTWRP